MNNLAALVEKKRKAQQKLADDEGKRTKTENTKVVPAKPQNQAIDATDAADVLNKIASQEANQELPKLAPEEVKRRLRLLSQPVTLFGEDEVARAVRLAKAQQEVQVQGDNDREDVQVFNTARMQKQKKEEDDKARLEKLTGNEAPGPQLANGDDAGSFKREGEASDPLAAQFAQAAAELKERLEEQNLCVEDKILRYLQKYCKVWEEDLDARQEADKDSGPGRQATLQFKQTVSYFQPLYRQLKKREVVPEMVAGIWLLIQGIQQRNYLHASDIYMHLAVGNAPWPIGVTSIGIHDRTAREKIGHTMNAAHIMNDEATRKYLQGLKRLVTFMQRAFPTDPSRAVDFDGFKDAARGAAGGGSDKLALLSAQQKGELKLLPAPHRLDTDGSVRVPEKWSNMIRRSEAFKEKNLNQTPPKTPPRTPPRA